MGAIVLAEPSVRPEPGRRRYAVPALLIAGWAALFAYSAAYLTEDLPFRPPQAEAARRAEAAAPFRADEAPRRIVVFAAPEAGAAPGTPAKDPATGDPAGPAAEPHPAGTAATAPTSPGAVQSASVAAPAATSPRPAQALAGADYVGTWGPTAAACGAPSRRRGYIPATITPERAKAGRTTCSFHDGHRAGNAWIMGAECSDRGRHWSSQVRLVVDGDRLTWSSSRGTSTYIRCNRRAG